MTRLAIWHERTPRERVAIAVIGGAIAILLFVAFAWLPLERARTRLTAELPRLRASIPVLQREADEAKRLRAQPALAASGAPSLAALVSGPSVPGAQLALLDDKRVRLTGGDVGFSALLEWIAAVQASHGLRVDSARIDALPAPGRVRAELVLAKS
jgi:general secretion pathway protein M